MARQKYTTGPGWRIEWRKFTKEDARRDLAKFRDDRPTDTSWVNALTRSMDLGLWDTYSPSQTPIAFDREGYRINGKHRLQAFVQSKLTEIVFPVVAGLSREAFKQFDQNLKPRKHQHAHNGRSNVYRDEARINWLETIVTADPSVKVTTQVFDALVGGKWRKQVEWADEVVKTQRGQGKAPYVAPLMYTHRAAPEFADKIAKSWANGGSGLPKQLLRIRDAALSTRYVTGDRRSRVGMSLKMLHALALMHQGKALPDRLNESLAGLRYWSEKLGDGAIGRWEKATIVGAEG